jgi:hypothetical protein
LELIGVAAEGKVVPAFLFEPEARLIDIYGIE